MSHGGRFGNVLTVNFPTPVDAITIEHQNGWTEPGNNDRDIKREMISFFTSSVWVAIESPPKHWCHSSCRGNDTIYTLKSVSGKHTCRGMYRLVRQMYLTATLSL